MATTSNDNDGDIIQELHCLSLYNSVTCKVLIQPFNSETDSSFCSKFTLPFLTKTSSSSSSSSCPSSFIVNEQYKPDTCRIKFNAKSDVWKPTNKENLLRAHFVAIDLIQTMQRHHDKQLLVSADITRCMDSAETLFFVNRATNNGGGGGGGGSGGEIQQQEQQKKKSIHNDIACISFSSPDKIQFVKLPSLEQEALQQVIKDQWDHGIAKQVTNQEYNVPIIYLEKSPWKLSSTNKTKVRILVLHILKTMYQHGWQKVVPIDTTVGRYDLESLYFFKNQKQNNNGNDDDDDDDDDGSSNVEMCGISLESTHQIHLFGTTDVSTLKGFEKAIKTFWKKDGIMEIQQQQQQQNDNGKRIKLNGDPWSCQDDYEYIAAGRLLCGLFETFYNLGWRYHCALNMTHTPSDINTIYMKRSESSSFYKSSDTKIGCMQIVGYNKMNLIRFPSKLLLKLIKLLDDDNNNPFVWSIERIEKHSNQTNATIHFNGTPHVCRDTEQKARQGKFYIQFLQQILNYSKHVKLIGCIDASKQTTGRDSSAKNMAMDSDMFIFQF